MTDSAERRNDVRSWDTETAADGNSISERETGYALPTVFSPELIAPDKTRTNLSRDNSQISMRVFSVKICLYLERRWANEGGGIVPERLHPIKTDEGVWDCGKFTEY